MQLCYALQHQLLRLHPMTFRPTSHFLQYVISDHICSTFSWKMIYNMFHWGLFTFHQLACSLKTETTLFMLFTHLLLQSSITDRQTHMHAPLECDTVRTWQRIMTWVTFGLLSLVSVLSSPVRTERTKSPGWLWLSRTRKLPFLPFSVKSFSASRPDKCPWNHLQSKWL